VRLTPAIMEYLSRHELVQIRSAVAASAITPLEIITRLASDESHQVRAAVAHNPSTPSELLLILMVDDNEIVKMVADRHMNRRLMGQEHPVESPVLNIRLDLMVLPSELLESQS